MKALNFCLPVTSGTELLRHRRGPLLVLETRIERAAWNISFTPLFFPFIYIFYTFLNSKRIQDMKVHALGFIISLRILYGLKYFESLTQGQQKHRKSKGGI